MSDKSENVYTLEEAVNRKLGQWEIQVAFGRELKEKIDELAPQLDLTHVQSCINQLYGEYGVERGSRYLIGDGRVVASIEPMDKVLLQGRRAHELLLPVVQQLNEKAQTGYQIELRADREKMPLRVRTPVLRAFYRMHPPLADFNLASFHY